MSKKVLLVFAIFALVEYISAQSSNRCAALPCKNQKLGLTECEELEDSYSCHCPYGIKGNRCQFLLIPSEKDLCLSNPCWRGAKCSWNGASDYSCDCPFGFGGKTCRLAVNNTCFTNQPCKNNAFCKVISLQGDYNCTCVGNWRGKNCDQAIPLCERPDFVCLNNGICRNNRCECTGDYSGTNCEIYSPPDQIVRVLNKGGYVAELTLTYEYPVVDVDVNGTTSISYRTTKLEATIALGQQKTFQIPYTVPLNGPRGVYLRVKAILGVQIFFTRIVNNPSCYHVWGTTLGPSWTIMNC